MLGPMVLRSSGWGAKPGRFLRLSWASTTHQGPGPVACNPVLQAQLLNEAGTELNIVMGLCVGHDSLFYKHAKAVTTTLVVKDRVLVHNPVMALYTAEGVLCQPHAAFGRRMNPSRPSGAGFSFGGA